MSIRELFLRLGRNNSYVELEEQSIIAPESDTFFVVSAIAAHMNLFDSGVHSAPARYITAQRVFSGTRFEDVGRYPLATPFEVMLSIFRFGDEDARPALDFFHTFLKEAVNVTPAEIIYLAPHELGLREAVLGCGVDPERVLSWERSIPLRLGPNRPEGHYIKMFAPYQHGLMPIATLGLMELDGKLAVDSALFLERLTCMQAGLPHWYGGEHFKPLVDAIKAEPQLTQLSELDTYLWANHLRSIVALLWDGAQPSGKGPGHMVRKLVRQLAGTVAGSQWSSDSITLLVQGAGVCLSNLGYDTTPALPTIVPVVQKLLNDSAAQIAQELQNFTMRLQKAEPLTLDELETWKGERGLQLDWMQSLATQHSITLPSLPTKSRFWLRNECLSFDPTQRISDPIGFLRAAEEQRMKGKQ